MTRCFPVVDDPGQFEPDPIKEAEAAREQAWELFVASLRDHAHQRGWTWVLWSAVSAFHGGQIPAAACCAECYDFARDHGWPDTLRAIAQALQADETFKRECEARR